MTANAPSSPRTSFAPGAPADAALEATKLTKVYRSSSAGASHVALDAFDVRVLPGEFVGVMGPSGSGKSTLLNLLATIDTPTSGAVRIGGADPAGMNQAELARFRRHRLGFVFQDYNLLESLSVRENILLPLVLDRVPLADMRARLADVAGLLGIEDLLERRTHEISGGQQQRTAIARALVAGPDVVLADELTGNLDSRAAFGVMEQLRRLNEERGVTIVMVTHDPFAASFCGRVVFIKDGRPHSELRRAGQRQAFFQQVIDNLSVLGGDPRDVPAARD